MIVVRYADDLVVGLPAADVMIANSARTPANPGVSGMIYSPAFRKLPSGSYWRICNEPSA
jgi:hypothetical protein